MKHLFLYISLLSSLFLLSCRPERPRYVIGVSQCSDDEWRHQQNAEMQREAGFYRDLQVVIRTAKDDSKRQIRDIRHFLDEGVDLLVISPNEAEPITPVVEEAYDRGIPVIVVDRKILSDKYTAYIGADNDGIGYAIGTYIAHSLNGQGTVVEITGLSGSTPAMERHAGFTRAISAWPGIRLLAVADGAWLRDRAEAQMDSLLDIYPQFDVLYAHNDRMADGAYEAAARRGREKSIRFFGTDALSGESYGLESVLEGKLSATFIYPTGGDEVVHTAMNILQGRPFEREMHLNTSVVDSTTAPLMHLQTAHIATLDRKIETLTGRVARYLERYATQRVVLFGSLTGLLLVIVLLGTVYRLLRLKSRKNRELLRQKELLEEQKRTLQVQKDQLEQLSHELEEATHAKLVFFTNISHDFRTPLTLMISQIEALLQTPALSPYIRTRLQKIYKSTYQFRELISELLDFRKMERGKQTLHLHTSDMVPFLKQIHEEFVSQARLQEIEFVLAVPEGSLLCQCDDRQLRKVFTNLLSNAFKHTPKGGKVELVLEELADAVKVKVIDNGEGIPQEALPYIFDRFYQVDSLSSAPAGSGIGLALAKGIIDLHHGTIDVQSALGYGSIFTVTLPKGHPDEAEMQAEAVAAEGVSPYPSVEPDADAGGQAVEAGTSGEKMCVLIVEDNEELLQMLISLLSPLYRVVIAMNGKEGLARAKDEHPDLILSDVMMPIMSGTEMCTLLKNDFDLCHIPIILLTALGADNNKLEGWQCGADDYIEKPFSNRLLLGRIANILRNRKLLQQKFGKGMTTDSADDVDIQALAFSPIDTQFLTKLKEVVENHLSDPDFDVNVLAQELAVSRSSLYNKLKALSSMTPNELILNARLKRAVEMLKTNPQMQITEIAFQNGFSSLRYFRHCFKTHFNCTPQEYRDGKKEEEQH